MIGRIWIWKLIACRPRLCSKNSLNKFDFGLDNLDMLVNYYNVKLTLSTWYVGVVHPRLKLLSSLQKSCLMTLSNDINPDEIEAIVCDVDGTLLTSSHKLHPVTTKVLLLLKKLKPKLFIIISTGKQFNACEEIRETLDLQDPSCHLNGSIIYRNFKVVSSVHLSPDYVRLFHSHYKAQTISTFYYAEDKVYHVSGDGNQFWADKLRAFKETIVDVDDGTLILTLDFLNQIDQGKIIIYKAAFCCDPAVLETYKNQLSSIPGKVVLVQALDFCVEAISELATKGNALKTLLPLLNVDLSHTICFGDGQNDVSMFEVAKYSVSMGNGMQVAKKSATHSTSSNDEGGVGIFLAKLFKLDLDEEI